MVPPRDVPINYYSFCTIAFPPILAYHALALLVIVPRTRFMRLGLLPVQLYFALRAGTMLDLSGGVEGHRFYNQFFMVSHEPSLPCSYVKFDDSYVEYASDSFYALN